MVISFGCSDIETLEQFVEVVIGASVYEKSFDKPDSSPKTVFEVAIRLTAKNPLVSGLCKYSVVILSRSSTQGGDV